MRTPTQLEIPYIHNRMTYFCEKDNVTKEKGFHEAWNELLKEERALFKELVSNYKNDPIIKLTQQDLEARIESMQRTLEIPRIKALRSYFIAVKTGSKWQL